MVSTPGFDPGNRGSSPCMPANKKIRLIMFEENVNSTQLSDKIAYFVTGKVVISDYMVDEPRTYNKSHIVYALDENHAERKFIEHYEKKTSEYDRYYSVSNVEVSETLI